MPKSTFTRDYKLDVLELARMNGKSEAHFERELGLPLVRAATGRKPSNRPNSNVNKHFQEQGTNSPQDAQRDWAFEQKDSAIECSPLLNVLLLG